MIEDKAIHKHGITENGSLVFSMTDIQIEPIMTSLEQFSQSSKIQIEIPFRHVVLHNNVTA